jgi:hypothetical protein
MENFDAIGDRCDENNNRRLVTVGKHDGKFWRGGKVLGDLSREENLVERNSARQEENPKKKG